MTHELVLTSVSQGLEPDSRGFCSVAENGTLSPQLVMRLKSISDYRHLYSPDTDDAVHNPVTYSHLIVPTHESTVHVLSRIASSGIDFQHEPNRLAHHVVLDREEQVPEGPAWILAQNGFHFSQWLTPSVRFAKGRPLPTLTAPPSLSRQQQIDRERRRLDAKVMDPFVDSPPSEMTELPPLGPTPCPFWELLTGDAGWGGVLAATIRSGRPAVLVFRPGTNVLPLFVESLSLIPSAMRWKATFSTYFTHYPEHVVCQWKAVPVDAPELRNLREDPTVLLIDLTSSLDKAPDGPYVEFARHGSEDSLPENEFQVDLFDDISDLFDDLSAPLVIPTPPPLDEPTVASAPSPFSPSTPSDEPVAPPVVVPPIQIRTSSRKTPNAVGLFLKMKSRGSFYAILGATFLCVIVLSIVVLDQMFDFGILRNPPAKPNAAASTPKSGEMQKRDAEAKPDSDVTPSEKDRMEKEEQQRVAEERRITQLKEKEERAAQDRKKLREEAERFLERFPRLNDLALNLSGTDVPAMSPPFDKFAPLHPFGSVILFEVFPLVRDPHLSIETRRLDEQAVSIEDNTAEQGAEIEDTNLPPSHFVWSVDGVAENEERISLLHLTLTQEGLSLQWQPEAQTPQAHYAAALLRFGFLRFYAEGIRDPSRIHSAPLFETKTTRPVYPAEVFADSATFDIETPFADEPYKSFFESGNVDSPLRLEVNFHPQKLPGVAEIVPMSESPHRYLVEIETTTTYKKTGDSGRDSFPPIAISFGVEAEALRVQWTDGYDAQRERLDEELKQNKTRLKDISEALEKIRAPNLGSTGILSDNLIDEQKELQAEQNEIEKHNKEIEAILGKLSEAHDTIAKNDEFRFEYRLFLVPKADGEDPESPLLKSEENVPIMEGKLRIEN